MIKSAILLHVQFPYTFQLQYVMRACVYIMCTRACTSAYIMKSTKVQTLGANIWPGVDALKNGCACARL